MSVAEAERRLNDLVTRAAAGEEVVLTRDGEAVVRLLPARSSVQRTVDRDAIKALQAEARAMVSPGPSADRSQDFLYDENGLPA